MTPPRSHKNYPTVFGATASVHQVLSCLRGTREEFGSDNLRAEDHHCEGWCWIESRCKSEEGGEGACEIQTVPCCFEMQGKRDSLSTPWISGYRAAGVIQNPTVSKKACRPLRVLWHSDTFVRKVVPNRDTCCRISDQTLKRTTQTNAKNLTARRRVTVSCPDRSEKKPFIVEKKMHSKRTFFATEIFPDWRIDIHLHCTAIFDGVRKDIKVLNKVEIQLLSWTSGFCRLDNLIK